MFIQTEPTPNPLSLKFLPGLSVLEEGTLSFSKKSPYRHSPLAKALLEIEGVESLFFAPDFITLTKTEEADWIHIKPLAIAAMIDHFLSGAPIILEGEAPSQEWAALYETDPVIRQIVDIIETRVRPAVAQDGGDITFDRFEEGIVYLRLQGACSGCPSSSATLKAGIENMLRYYVPEVEEVRAV